uniref:At3g05675-like ankyrin-like domain-containing protein n=1 Tax=Kalanchoe fedtschenkoi TaxID=63787 RepID=A0A7N0UAJ7_KALFE
MATTKQVSAMLKQGFLFPDPSLKVGHTHSSSSNPLSLSVFPSSSPPASPTLFEMMTDEQNREARGKEEARRRMSGRIDKILEAAPGLRRDYGGCRGWEGMVKLTVVSRDGFRVSMEVDRAVLVEKSRFFKEKFFGGGKAVSHTVEICDCDDVEVYVEVVLWMHFEEDLKARLVGEEVSKVLGLLKVSAAMMFDAGIVCCLEYLEAVPWTEEEEEKVLLQLSQLQFSELVGDVLKRVVSNEVSTSSRVDDIISRLITGVLQSKDDKARREMKNLLSKLLKENGCGSQNRLNVSKDALYHLCHRCLSSLILCLSEATNFDGSRQDQTTLMGEIAVEAENIQWIVDILIDRKMGHDFVQLWADQKDLATLHSKIPVKYRHEISKITAHLCIAIGRGRVLVPKQVRSALLCTWLDALYDDFNWMRRTPRSVDKNLVEHGLGQTILTLPLQQQQSFFLAWFDRYLDKGDDCPNIQRAFEVWWRRAFTRQCALIHERPQLQLVVSDYPS